MTPFSKLVVLAVVTELIYLLVALAGQSLHMEGVGDWSLLAILGLFGAAVLCYLAALGVALRARQDRRLAVTIACCAVLFRLTLLPTDPVAEIDIYRYLWDGQAVAHGVDPYRYSPDQVLFASRDASIPADLAMLVSLRDASPEMTEILRRVHFGQLPTIYPPTSQAVFAVASWITPEGASIFQRMVLFKAWFVAFDVATLALVMLILRRVGRPVAWSLAYGWCPLVVKEIANSGHLDAVAVFLTTAAIYLIVRACFAAVGREEDDRTGNGAGRRTAIIAALMLSLAIGAKLYPVVLVPLFLAVTRRQCGWRTAIGMVVVLLMATAVVMWPMVPKRELAELPAFRIPSASEDLPPLPPPRVGTEPRDPSESLRAFLGEWEMNDFLFLLLMENIRPVVDLPPEEVAWFSMVPESWRKPVRRCVGQVTGVEPSRTPFVLSRAITSAAFLALAIVLAWRAREARTAAAFLEAAFLTVAWFWLILPTGNPWYWAWAVPLLPFARGRAWLLMSGLVLIYYLRFWLVYHYPEPPLLGTHYNGALFFDYIVTWLEFGPWFAVLLIAYLLRRRPSEPAQHNAAAMIATVDEAGSGTAVASPPNKSTKPGMSSKSKSPS